MTQVLANLGIALAIGISAVFGVVVYQQEQSQNLRNQAVDGCLKSSLYRNTINNPDGSVTTTEEAIKTSVEACLQLKGY